MLVWTYPQSTRHPRLALVLALASATLAFSPACGGSPNGASSGAGGGTSATGVGSTSTAVSGSSATATGSASTGSSTGSGAYTPCDALPACAASADESLTITNHAPTPPAVVRAWVVRDAQGVAQSVELFACFTEYGEDLKWGATLAMSSSPAATGPSTAAHASYSSAQAGSMQGATPQLAETVTLAAVGNVGETISGSFDLVLDQGGSTMPFSGQFKACRQDDVILP